MDSLVQALLENSYELTKKFTGEMWTKLQNYPEGKNARANIRSLLAAKFDDWIKAAGPDLAAKAARRKAMHQESFAKYIAPNRLFSTDGWASVGVEEIQDSRSVVPFQVQFDEEQDAWYAEVLLHPGVLPEYAFVRLALARYQPHSLMSPDLRLSKPMVVDYAQLSPARTVSVWRDPADEDQVCVQVFSSEPYSAATVTVSIWKAVEDGTGLVLEAVLTDLKHGPQHQRGVNGTTLYFGRIERDFFHGPKKMLVREDGLGESLSSNDPGQAKRDLLQKISSAGNPPYLDILDI